MLQSCFTFCLIDGYESKITNPDFRNSIFSKFRQGAGHQFSYKAGKQARDQWWLDIDLQLDQISTRWLWLHQEGSWKWRYDTCLGCEIDKLAESISKAGILVFFSSYSVMKKCRDVWKKHKFCFRKTIRYEDKNQDQMKRIFQDHA